MENNWCGSLAEFWAAMNSVEWLEWARALFDLIKGISWPLAIFFLVWLFRHQIRDRIKDLISAGPSGVVLQASQQVQTTQSALSTSAHPMPTVATRAEVIEAELANVHEAAKMPILVRSLAEAQVARHFEFIFANIFGSQIVALRRLKADKEIAVRDAMEFFDAVVKPMDGSLYEVMNFEEWSSFLLRMELARLEGERVLATDLGNDFLYFVDKLKPGIFRPH